MKNTDTQATGVMVALLVAAACFLAMAWSFNVWNVNDALQSSPVGGTNEFIEVVGVDVVSNMTERYVFATYPEHNDFVYMFRDKKHFMQDRRERQEDARHLIGQPDKFTEETALAFAVDMLEALRYDTSEALDPVVEQWQWNSNSEEGIKPMAFYKVTWPWKHKPNWDYYKMEIDGIRGKVTYFFTMKHGKAEESLEK